MTGSSKRRPRRQPPAEIPVAGLPHRQLLDSFVSSRFGEVGHLGNVLGATTHTLSASDNRRQFTAELIYRHHKMSALIPHAERRDASPRTRMLAVVTAWGRGPKRFVLEVA